MILPPFLNPQQHQDKLLQVTIRATVLKILVGEADDEEGASTSANRRLQALGVRYLQDGVCHEGEWVCVFFWG